MSISISSSLLSSSGTSTTGLGQGIDVQGIVSQLVSAAQAPERQWQAQQQQLDVQVSTLNDLNSKIATLLDKVNSLKDPAGSIAARTVTSSQSGIVSASAIAGTPSGNHVVVVSSLAKTGSYYTNAVASSSTPLTLGSFTIQIGSGSPVTITVDNTNNTLTNLAASINNQNLGVTASVVNDANGARLSIVSNSSGAANDITISNDTTGMGFTKAVTGSNASLIVDGVPVSSASNTVTGVLPGMTLNLVSASPGTEVAISVTSNTDTVTKGVQDFVDAYNTIIQELSAQFTFNATANQAGPLAGDSAARVVQSQLLSALTYSITGNGSISSLRDLGITMNNDGTLTVDSSKLSDAVSNNFAQVQTFFQGVSGSQPPSGFATILATQLNQLTDPTQGAFNVDIKGMTDTKASLQNQIDDFEVYVASQQQQWFTYYDRVNVMLQQLPLLQAQLQAELGNSSK
jgi:flagellar hook-associated protein 2